MPTLWKAKQPYNVNVAASTAAIAALDDLQTLKLQLNRITDQRESLYEALKGLPFLDPYPSRANFILCKVIGIDANELKTILATKFGILIRYFNKPGLQDHVRITVGTKDQIQSLLSALHEIGKEI
jgi:histidinol-phosphate aminotransferase